MKLYEIWKNMAGQLNSREEYDRFWNTYFSMETENYRKLLSDPARIYSGTEKDLAAEFGMDQATFCGFIDGINTSLRTAVDLETLEEDTPVTLDVDYERGMGVSIGRLREDTVYDYKFIGLSHNTLRGAAGGAGAPAGGGASCRRSRGLPSQGRGPRAG